MKKTTYLPQEESTYKALQSFNNVDEMNAAIKKHKQMHELSQTERDVLDAISRYACKYVGITYLSKEKMAQDAGYKNRRTAIRACKRLEALGIIEQHETRRISGDKRRSSNIIVITNIKASSCSGMDELVNAEPCEVTTESHGKEALYKSINSSNTYDTNKGGTDTQNAHIDNNQITEKVINDSIRNNTPSGIVDLLSPFFYGSELYKYVGIVFKAKYHRHIKIRIEAHVDAFRACISDVIRRYKRGWLTSLDGYLYASIKRLTRRLALSLD